AESSLPCRPPCFRRPGMMLCSNRSPVICNIGRGRGDRLMAEHQIRFEDGAAYERMMGTWSRLAGEVFLDWLMPGPGLRWIDIGCGNGAFTELVVDRCAPAEIHGIDPSPAQLAFARTRPAARLAQFHQGG